MTRLSKQRLFSAFSDLLCSIAGVLLALIAIYSLIAGPVSTNAEASHVSDRDVLWYISCVLALMTGFFMISHATFSFFMNSLDFRGRFMHPKSNEVAILWILIGLSGLLSLTFSISRSFIGAERDSDRIKLQTALQLVLILGLFLILIALLSVVMMMEAQTMLGYDYTPYSSLLGRSDSSVKRLRYHERVISELQKLKGRDRLAGAYQPALEFST